MDQKLYLVRYAGDRFFYQRTADGKAAFGSPYMSRGRRMSYLVACEVVKILLEMGYEDAIVCDCFGSPVTLESIRNPQQPDVEEFAEVWLDKPMDAPKDVEIEQ